MEVTEDRTEQQLRALLCCCGDDHAVGDGWRPGRRHINIVQLHKLARWPYMAVVNFLVAESSDYPLASAVVCDYCLSEGREILYAIKGEPGPDGEVVYSRVPVSELEEPVIYWPDLHPDAGRLQEGYEAMSAGNERMAEDDLLVSAETWPPYDDES